MPNEKKSTQKCIKNSVKQNFIFQGDFQVAPCILSLNSIQRVSVRKKAERKKTCSFHYIYFKHVCKIHSMIYNKQLNYCRNILHRNFSLTLCGDVPRK